MTRYAHQFLQYSESSDIESNCNAIIFINRSGNDVMINNFVLQVGESLSIDTNEGGQDITRYHVVFDPLDTAPKLYVIRRVVHK